jgi:hypothetical protein
MMAGNRRFGDLKRVILNAPNRGAIHVQLVCAAAQALSQNNKFGHGLTEPIMDTARFKSN